MIKIYSTKLLSNCITEFKKHQNFNFNVIIFIIVSKLDIATKAIYKLRFYILTIAVDLT